MNQHARQSGTDRRTVSRPVVLMAAFLVLSAASIASAQAPAMRSWTSGEFKIEAKFVSVAGNAVTLQQADGETLEIELSALSPADQKYVATQKANPFKKKAASPFKPKAAMPAAAATSTNDGPEPAEEPGSAGRLVRPRWDGVQQVMTTPSTSGWKVTISTDGIPPAPEKLRSVPVPQKSGFFDGPKGVVFNGTGTRAVVGYAGANPGMNQKGSSRVSLLDLANGKLQGSGGQFGLYAPLALSDDGAQVLMRTDTFGPGGHDRLEFWTLGKSGVAKGEMWVPHEDAKGANGGDRDIRWGAYLDETRFATASEAGVLVIWRTKPLKPLATFTIQGGCTPALSPDRKLLAFATSKEIGLLDVNTLDVVAVRAAPMPNMAWTSFAFSPTGKRLACKVFINKVYVYEVATGDLYREVSLQGLNAQTAPVLPDDDLLIVGEHTLIDLESQVRLWQYQGNERVVTANNGVTWFELAASQDRAGALIPSKVPPPSAQEALAKAARDPNFFIFKPGATVSVDASGIPDASQRENVIRSLTANLAKSGVKVAPGSPVVVQASMTQGKEQEVAYRRFGGGFQVDRFKVHPWTSQLRIVYEGKSAWESGASSLPFMDMTRLEKNESLQDHVRKFDQPNYAYFGKAELPKLVTRPNGQGSGTLGISQVTLSGIR